MLMCLQLFHYIDVLNYAQNDHPNFRVVFACHKNWTQNVLIIQIFNKQFYMVSFSFTQKLHVQYRKKRILKNKQTSNHFEPQKIIRLKEGSLLSSNSLAPAL